MRQTMPPLGLLLSLGKMSLLYITTFLTNMIGVGLIDFFLFFFFFLIPQSNFFTLIFVTGTYTRFDTHSVEEVLLFDLFRSLSCVFQGGGGCIVPGKSIYTQYLAKGDG